MLIITAEHYEFNVNRLTNNKSHHQENHTVTSKKFLLQATKLSEIKKDVRGKLCEYFVVASRMAEEKSFILKTYQLCLADRELQKL